MAGSLGVVDVEKVAAVIVEAAIPPANLPDGLESEGPNRDPEDGSWTLPNKSERFLAIRKGMSQKKEKFVTIALKENSCNRSEETTYLFQLET